jgi:hypothetical protein
MVPQRKGSGSERTWRKTYEELEVAERLWAESQ